MSILFGIDNLLLAGRHMAQGAEWNGGGGNEREPD
jgi:hypothetical protein